MFGIIYRFNFIYRTILLSVISLLNEPNINSAAHVDASVSYRKWKDSNGVDDGYAKVVKYICISLIKNFCIKFVDFLLEC